MCLFLKGAGTFKIGADVGYPEDCIPSGRFLLAKRVGELYSLRKHCGQAVCPVLASINPPLREPEVEAKLLWPVRGAGEGLD